MLPTPAQLRALARNDPALARWLRRLPPYPGFPDRANPRHSSNYAALASAIVYQQLSTKAATTIWSRVCALTPGAGFPEPEELLALDATALRGAGLSQAKMLALQDLSRRIAARELPLDRLARLGDEAVVEHLVAVRGIGVWSAQMFLMFRLGRLDVFAPGDLGLQEGVRLLDGLAERPAARELAVRAERWAPLRSVASWTLWRLVEHERERLRESALSRDAVDTPSALPPKAPRRRVR